MTDLDEASALGHYSDIIEIYSNSWGPDDSGFTVSGPGTLLLRTYQVGVREVHSKLLLLSCVTLKLHDFYLLL